MRGLRDLDDGPERIIDPEELARARRRAIRVTASTLSTAAVATALILIP